MPDTSGGKVTSLSDTVGRLVRGVRDTIAGVGVGTWFGPSQPLPPIAPDGVKGRQFDYSTGINLNYTPRGGTESANIGFAELRALADNLPLLRTVIETRKDQIESMGWMIKPKGVQGGKFSDAGKMQDPDIAAVTQFFAMPDRRNGFATWMRMVLEEIFVTDALTIEPRLTRGGVLYSLDLIDGATIKPLVGEDGRPPMPPDPAYQQILKGIVAGDFSSDELLYLPRNRRVNRLYGFSPVEQIVLTVNIALRRDTYTLSYYKEGTLPEAFATLPKEWSAEQIKNYQTYWDALMTDNLAGRRKLRFMPAEFALTPVREPPLKDLFDEWLARIICYAFSVPVTPFVSQVNRATADTLKVEAAQEGLTPLKNWLKFIFDVVIQRYVQKPNLEFAWDDADDTNVLERAQADALDIQSRVSTVNEVRDERGKPPLSDEQADGAPPPTVLDVAQAKQQAGGDENKDSGFGGKGKEVAKSAPFAAGICFLTPDRKALFLRRTGDDHGGEWRLPGGKVESGEAPNEAAARETAEEAGIQVDPDDLWQMFSTTTISDSGPQFATFLHYVDDEESVSLDRKESSDYAWASIDNPPQPLHPGVAKTLPMLAGYKHPAEKFAKYSPNQARDDHGRFASSGVGSLVQTRRRKPREVQGAKWEATTQAGVRVEAAFRAVKGAARISGAAYAAQFIPALRLAVKRGAFQAALGITGSRSTALWAAGPVAMATGIGASLVLTSIAGEGVHDIFASGHALLEQACDALGVNKAYADRAVTLTRAAFYKTLKHLAPDLHELALDLGFATGRVGKAAGNDDQQVLLQLLRSWHEHGDALATVWVAGFKKGIEHSNLEDDLKEFARKFADGLHELFLKALDEAMTAEEGAEKLAKSHEDWPKGKAPKPKHARNMRALWNDIFEKEAKKAADAFRAKNAKAVKAAFAVWEAQAAGFYDAHLDDNEPLPAWLRKGGDTIDIDFSDYQDEVAEALAEAAADGGGAGLKELFGGMDEPASGSIRTAVFEAANDRARKWADAHAAELVAGVSETTRDMIRGVISKGVSANLSIPEIADQIEESTAFSDDRALLIADTEVANANSAGALEGYRAATDSGLKVKKQWVVAVGACPLCEENAEAGPIDLDEEFPNGAMAPAQHPHCRCAVSAVVESDAQENDQ